MLYTIQNQNLTVVLSDHGAELQSVQSTDGTEWLWQGDPAYWERRAPVLFPHCGRFWNNLVTAYGVPCNPGMHGFLRDQPTVAEEVSGSSIVFRQTENSETLGRYPFPYEVRICYALEEDTITVRAEIKNTGTRTMPYGYGGHPGFRVPFAGGDLEDYYIRFCDKSGAEALCFDADNCFITGGSRPFPLRDGDRFDLCEDFFANGSTFLCHMPPEVTLMTDRSGRHITLRYPGFPYLGLWKAPGGAFLCIEPWCSLPATSGQSTELTEKSDLLRLEPGQTHTHTYSMQFSVR